MRPAPVQVPNHKSEEELGRSDESRECGRHIAVPKLRSAEAEANVNAIKVHTAPYGNGFGRLRNQPVQPQATINWTDDQNRQNDRGDDLRSIHV